MKKWWKEIGKRQEEENVGRNRKEIIGGRNGEKK
jgi:hypothetical protein